MRTSEVARACNIASGRRVPVSQVLRYCLRVFRVNTQLAIPVPEKEIGHCPRGAARNKPKVTKVKV